MSKKILPHIFFWLFYILLYASVKMLFAASSDLAYPPVTRFFRFFFMEIVFLPWKIIPFYLLFYVLIPRFLAEKAYPKILIGFLGVLFICILGARSMIVPVNQIWYNETPDFQVYSVSRMLYSLLDIIPAFALASTAKLLKGRISTMQKFEALQQEKRKAELNFLKAQTNPHFLFNTLNNLYGLARKQDKNTEPAIMKLANLMRYILYECSEDRIAISKEIEIIEAYIELEKLRYDDSLQVQFQQEIDTPNQPIAPLILLPFVENAFKHGAGENRFGTKIDLELTIEKGKINFQIENTVDQEIFNMEDGVGLENVKRQLELIYGDDFDLKIDTQGGIFSAELEIG